MKRALLVGIINYPNPDDRLKGCINDVNHMKQLLISYGGYAPEACEILADASATRDNIVQRLKALVFGLRSGDRISFFYSGHGAQLPEQDPNGNVVGLHDVLCPYDFDWTAPHAIRDVDFTEIFGSIPDGAKLSWLSDSCFAGGYTKLFAHLVGGATHTAIKTIPPPPKIHDEILSFLLTQSAKATHFKAVAQTLRNVELLSACTANELSEDAQWPDGAWDGVFTHYLVDQYLNQNGALKPSSQLIADLSAAIDRTQFTQTPQLHGDPALSNTPVLR